MATLRARFEKKIQNRTLALRLIKSYIFECVHFKEEVMQSLMLRITLNWTGQKIILGHGKFSGNDGKALHQLLVETRKESISIFQQFNALGAFGSLQKLQAGIQRSWSSASSDNWEGL